MEVTNSPHPPSLDTIECVPLIDILKCIERPLEEVELWALMKEVLSMLLSVDETSTHCEEILISSETVALDPEGRLLFLRPEAGPKNANHSILPPDGEQCGGNSTKSHLLMLGMTIHDAAYYSTSAIRDQPLSRKFHKVVREVTAKNHEDRPSIQEVFDTCVEALEGRPSAAICQRLVQLVCPVDYDQETEQCLPEYHRSSKSVRFLSETSEAELSKTYRRASLDHFKQRLQRHLQSLSSVGSSTDFEVHEGGCYTVTLSHPGYDSSVLSEDSCWAEESVLFHNLNAERCGDATCGISTNDLQLGSVTSGTFEKHTSISESGTSTNDLHAAPATSGTFVKHTSIPGSERSGVYEPVSFFDTDPSSVRTKLDYASSDDSLNADSTQSAFLGHSCPSIDFEVTPLTVVNETLVNETLVDESVAFAPCDPFLNSTIELYADDTVDDSDKVDSADLDSKMNRSACRITRAHSVKTSPVLAYREMTSKGQLKVSCVDDVKSMMSPKAPLSPTQPFSPVSKSSDSDQSCSSVMSVSGGRKPRSLERTRSLAVTGPGANSVVSPPRMGSPTRGRMLEVMPPKIARLKENSPLQRTASMKDKVNHLLRRYSFTGKRPLIAKTSLALKERMAAHRRREQSAVLTNDVTLPRIMSSSSRQARGDAAGVIHARSRSDSTLTAPSKPSKSSLPRSVEGLNIGIVLHRIGCGLPETELWALCRECVLTILDKQSIPCISMDTVLIQDSGHVSFIPLPDNCDIDPMFFAPEMSEGCLNEKTCVFSVAALLWLAADFNLTDNQEPEFSDNLEDLMMSMTHDEPELRPTLLEVLETCNEAAEERRESSHQICRHLLRDAHNASNYGRSNSLVQELMQEEVKQKVEVSRTQLLEEIKDAGWNKQLKPASERKLAEKPKESSLHDELMTLIRDEHKQLKSCDSQPEMSVREIYESNPNLMQHLKKVTSKAMDKNTEPPPTDNVLSASKIRAEIRAALGMIGADAARAKLDEYRSKLKEAKGDKTSEENVSSPGYSEMTDSPSASRLTSNDTSEMSPSYDDQSLSEISAGIIPKPKLFTRDLQPKSSNLGPRKENFGVKNSGTRLKQSMLSPESQSDFQVSGTNSDFFSTDSALEQSTGISMLSSSTGVDLNSAFSTMSPPSGMMSGFSMTSSQIGPNSGLSISSTQVEETIEYSGLSPSYANSGFTAVTPMSGTTAFSVVSPPSMKSGFSVVSPSANSGFSVVSPQSSNAKFSSIISPPSSSGFSAASKKTGSNTQGVRTAAKNAGEQGQSLAPAKRTDPAKKHNLPKAFISPATHFTPIVLESETGFFKKKNDAPAAKLAKVTEEKKDVQVKKIDNLVIQDRNRAMAEKLKELKKQLTKNYPPPNMALDLENESLFETGPSGSRSHPSSRVTTPIEKVKCHTPPETELRASAVQDMATVPKKTKENFPKRAVESPDVEAPVDKNTNKLEEKTVKPDPPYEFQQEIDPAKVHHLQDPKTGIVYCMIPVTNSVLSSSDPSSSEQKWPLKKDGQAAFKDNRHMTTSSDDEDRRLPQPRRRRDRRRVSKGDGKTVKVKNIPDRIQEGHVETRADCADSRPIHRGRSFKSATKPKVVQHGRAKSQERLLDHDPPGVAKPQHPPVSGKLSHMKRSVSDKNLPSFSVKDRPVDIGTPVGTSTDFDNTDITFSAIDNSASADPTRLLEVSEQVVPHLSFDERETEALDYFGDDRAAGNARISPIMPQSPSPPLSKDSGVSGLILKSNGGASYPSLMDRLLSNDAMKRHEILRKVVLLIREEFAFDGYMENGIEDLAMAEWLISLSNVSWETFCRAVSEKYCDFYWSEELLYSLYDSINGKSPYSRLAHNPDFSHLRGATARVLGVDDPSDFGVTTQSSQDSGPDGRGRNHPPITPGVSSKPPKSRRFISDTSDSTDSEMLRNRHRRGKRKSNLDKNKSYSASNLLDAVENDVLSKSRSEEALLDDMRPKRVSKLTPNRLKKSKSQDELSLSRHEPDEVVRDLNEQYVGHNFVRMPDAIESAAHTPTLPRLLVRPSESETDSVSTSHDGSAKARPIGQAPILRRESSSEWRKLRRQRPVREDSLSSHSSAGVPARPPSATLTNSSQGSNSASSGDVQHLNKTSVMCYSIEMQRNILPEIKSMEEHLQLHRARGAVEAKIAEIDQQMMMENKMRQKSKKFIRKMLESGKTASDQKNVLSKVSKEITEMTDKLVFLELARRHLEMLHAEQWGIDDCLLPSLAHASPKSPMDLHPSGLSLLLQYQSQRNLETGVDTHVMQAGTPKGLMAYLFAKESLSGGYIHEFFYCYRYFTTAKEVLTFITDKFTAASSLVHQNDNHQRIKHRAMDLLQYWVEGFYNLDFKADMELVRYLEDFVDDKVSKSEKSMDAFIQLLDDCRDGCHEDFSKASSSSNQDGQDDHPSSDSTSQKKWDTLKNAFTKTKNQKNKVISCTSKQKVPEGDLSLPNFSQPGDAFSLTDFSSQKLAEQLTLIEQALFRDTHPVMFMNSKAQGIGVALATGAGSKKSVSAGRLSVWDGPTENSLFVGGDIIANSIQLMIEHSHRLTHWVAVEILCCTSTKVQSIILTKFIYTAKMCVDMRNFATGVSIIDALENYIIRQLPVWRTLPSKSVSIMEDLTQIKSNLKKDSMLLLKNQEAKLGPTIPSTVVFLLHVQQLEVGGFTHTSGMFKWNKLRNIAHVIDQIRIFKDHFYTFETSQDLRESIHQRMKEYFEHDLQTLASQYEINITKLPSSGKLPDAFRNLKKKFHGKSDS